MRKAGGIIALVAGIFAVLAAALSIMSGDGALASNDPTALYLAYSAVLSSFLVILAGALILGTSSAVPVGLLIICSIIGMILGETMVTGCLALALIGGILAPFEKSPGGRAPTWLRATGVVVSSLLLTAVIVLVGLRLTTNELDVRKEMPGLPG